ncbi:hypothetical protein DKM44_05930 [Deinococcus irradiatisoli]|uniref:Uncharacterized protein n=1 Tax=Deinococcus irradiatisoli TaxID=2202254 RepID=A0A2Z3JHH0_9DEIO|nr:DUF3761 domain-containing protein [Deinococcus irradiatisoli]AWN22820.1 hypothetical protein DKM44_05930 [Deinococcus irradiatisoli]
MADSKPAGASAECRNGSYRRGTYSRHGGVASWF